jgi:hypothetical protein
MASQALLIGVCCLLQTVDRFNNLFVTAYVTPGNARFLLLHEGKNDEAIRMFFTEVHELFLRVSLPEYRPGADPVFPDIPCFTAGHAYTRLFDTRPCCSAGADQQVAQVRTAGHWDSMTDGGAHHDRPSCEPH